jgi:hypothetical protein
VSQERALRLSLQVGAAIWLLLLLVGFVAPGGWTWGMAGPIGHIENFMISLWLVTLVLAPLLASRDPLHRTGAIQVYLLGLAAIAVSSASSGSPRLLDDGLPIAMAALSAVAVILAHRNRSTLRQV